MFFVFVCVEVNKKGRLGGGMEEEEEMKGEKSEGDYSTDRRRKYDEGEDGEKKGRGRYLRLDGERGREREAERRTTSKKGKTD